ncbi:MAG: hypothetical protein WBK55_01555 [Alphaproteobacteria bacterium]
MTQEPAPSSPSQQFTIVSVQKKPISASSNTFTGTVTDGKTTHAFKIMASERFNGFMAKTWPGNPADLEDSGAVLLVVYEGKTEDHPMLHSEGGKWINGFNPTAGEQAATKTAILTALATQLKNTQPAPVL